MRRRRALLAAGLAAVLAAVLGAAVLTGGRDAGQEWQAVEPGPFAPLAVGRAAVAEVTAGAQGAASSAALVLHNQGAEPVVVKAVEAVEVSTGVAAYRIDGHWPDSGEEIETTGEFQPYPPAELVDLDGVTLAPAGEDRSSLRVRVGIRLAEGSTRGVLDGFVVRFETPTGRYQMPIDHEVSVVR